jgi:hypothetical protein
MGKIDAVKERERLVKLYAGMSDLELAKVGKNPESLTEWARSALLDELTRRGLEWKPEPQQTKAIAEEQILMLLGKYDDRQSAGIDRDLLARSGVEAYFFEEEPAAGQTIEAEQVSTGTRLLIRAKDLAVARQKLTEREEWERVVAQDTPNESEPSKPVIVRRYRDMPQAFVGKSMLENAGIECFLQDANVIRMDWLWSNAMGGIKLLVREEHAEEAEKILGESPTDAKEPGDPATEKQ